MNSQLFIDKFASSANLEKLGFINLTLLSNEEEIGFSVQKKLPVQMQEFIGVKDNKEYRSLLFLNIPKQSLENNIKSIKPIDLSASLHLFKHNRFYFDDQYIRRKLYRPININSHNEYFLDLENERLLYKNRPIPLEEILGSIYQLHIKPTMPIKGIVFRSRLAFKHLQLMMIKILSIIFVSLLWLISGTKHSLDIIQRFALESSKAKSTTTPHTTMGKTIKIFGYEASIRAIFVYCLIHLITYSIFVLLGISNNFASKLLRNPFFALMYAICSLTLFEAVLPRIFKCLIDKLTHLYVQTRTKSMRI